MDDQEEKPGEDTSTENQHTNAANPSNMHHVDPGWQKGQHDSQYGTPDASQSTGSQSPSTTPQHEQFANPAWQTGQGVDSEDYFGNQQQPQQEDEPQKGKKKGNQKEGGVKGKTKERGKEAGKKATKEAAKRILALATDGTSEVVFSLWKYRKWILIIAAIVFFLIIFIFIILGGGGGGGAAEQVNQQNNGQNNPLVIQKSGPNQSPNSTNFIYTITVSYPYDAQELTISDTLDPNTQFVDSQWKKYTLSGNTIQWNMSQNIPNYNGKIVGPINQTFTFTVRPLIANDYVYNLGATAQVVGGGGNVSADVAKILPTPLPPDPANVQNTKIDVLNRFKQYPFDITIYKQAAAQTSIPWPVFAGLHYREGGADPNQSLVSGAPIGTNEPDVVAAGGCIAATLKGPAGVADGLPEPLAGGGCGFSSLLDSALYAAKVLKGKPGGSLSNFQDLVTALSHYNGGGDANCPQSVGYNVGYGGKCPPPYYGDDDTYAMDMFDAGHYPMFVIYCNRGIPCNPAPQDPNPGVATVIKWVSQSGIQ